MTSESQPLGTRPLADQRSRAPRVSVVIPNLDGMPHLPDCLGSLTQQTFRDFETIIVDNGSRDGSGELIRTRYPWVQLVEFGANRGFSAAANEGIRRSSSEFVVLLNNDTRADPRWLERLVAAMDETPDAPLAASKLLSFDPPHHIDAAGDSYSLSRASGFRIGEGEPASSFDRRSWVFGASAAAALYRRSLFDDIGLFDEEFFLLFEDVELDLRAQVAGHRCLYVPDAVVYHKRGASTDTWSPEVQALALRNRVWAAAVNLPGPLFLVWCLCFTPRLAWILVHVAMFGRHPAPAWAGPLPSHPRMSAFNVYLKELWTALRRLLSKRRERRRYRRLGSFRLLPALTASHRPVETAAHPSS